MAPGATVHYFGANSCADQDINATLANIVDTRAADIVSSSFGETMHRLSGDIDPALISQATQLFQYAATEGIGLYYATGDCGDDSSRTGPGCDPESARAQTEWPASSPWVTGVGGTALALGAGASPLWQASMGDRRSALSDDGKSWVPFPGDFYFGGGGGTSEDFQQPAYQQGVVPDALARTLGTGAKAAGPMRTLPDVAMDGDLLTAVQVGVTDPASGQYGETSVGGTSAAAPMFAAAQADGQQAQVASGGKRDRLREPGPLPARDTLHLYRRGRASGRRARGHLHGAGPRHRRPGQAAGPPVRARTRPGPGRGVRLRRRDRARIPPGGLPQLVQTLEPRTRGHPFGAAAHPRTLPAVRSGHTYRFGRVDVRSLSPSLRSGPPLWLPPR